MLHIWIRKKYKFRGSPVERSHREVVILPLSNSELFFKVSEAVELMAGIEFFVVLPVAAFYFAVMLGRVRFDQFVPNAKLIQCSFEECWFRTLAIRHPIGEFKSIVCLNTRNRIGELLYDIFEELGRGIGAMLLVGL